MMAKVAGHVDEKWSNRRLSFFSRCQNGLKIGRLFFLGDDADFDLFKPSRFHPSLQIAFGETEPAIAIKIAGLLEVVLEQIQDHHLSAGPKDSMDCGDGSRWVFGVMQGLA